MRNCSKDYSKKLRLMIEVYNYGIKDKFKFRKMAEIAGIPRLTYWFHLINKEWNQDNKDIVLDNVIKASEIMLVFASLEKEGTKLALDSMGVWGWDLGDAFRAWDACQGDAEKFKEVAKYEFSHFDRFDGYEYDETSVLRDIFIENIPISAIHPKKIARMYQVLRLDRHGAIHNRFRADPVGFNDFLGLDYPRRITGAELMLQEKERPIDLRDLKKSLKGLPDYKVLKDTKLVDPLYKWYWYTKKLGISIPKNINKKFLRAIRNPLALNKKLVKFVLDEINELSEYDIHIVFTLNNLLYLFGPDLQGLKKVWNHPDFKIGEALTRLNVFAKYSEEDKKDFKGLVLKDTRFFKLVRIFPSIKKKLGRNPVSYREARIIGASLRYKNVKGEKLAIIASECRLSQKDFNKFQSKWLKLVDKIKEKILPHIEVESCGYRVYTLPSNDPRGLLLGEYTNCCQSIDEAGEECAIAGTKQKDKGFLIVEDDGEILAQSWYWLDKNDPTHIVLDSIESKGLSENQAERVAKAILAWFEEMRRRGHLTDLYVGNTNYGYTEEVREFWPLSDSAEKYCKIRKYKGYMDGKYHYKILI